MDNNAYLLVCTATGEALLIDAANEPDRLAEVAASPATLSCAPRSPRTATTTTGRPSARWPTSSTTRQIAHPLDAPELPVPVDDTVEHGDTISVGRVPLEVIHLRGHTPGSIAVLYRDDDGPHLFTGDSLFPGVLDGQQVTEDFTSLMDDLEERVFGPLPDETWIYPGHGDDTTLGRERPHLAEWRGAAGEFQPSVPSCRRSCSCSSRPGRVRASTTPTTYRDDLLNTRCWSF